MLESLMAFLIGVEGIVLHPYSDVGDTPTYCVGETHDVESKDYNQTDCFIRLGLRVDDLTSRLAQYPWWTKLTSNQQVGLASFVYNIGERRFAASRLARRMSEGELNAFPSEAIRWVKVKGKVNKGLINRRIKEIELWETN